MSPLLIAAILQADPKITLGLPISPLSVIVKEVSDQAKTPLKVSGYDPHRRMFVQVKNMPASRVRQALATATGGKWIQTSQSWQLQLPSPEAAWQEIFRKAVRTWSESRKTRAVMDTSTADAMIRRSLALQKGSLTPAQQRERSDLIQQGPREQLLLRTLLALPKDEIGGMVLGERRVYALSPNALQRPLPSTFARHFQRFLAEDELMQDRVAALAPEAKAPREFGWSSLTQYAGQRSLKEGTVAHLVLQRSFSSISHAAAEMALYSRNGEKVASWNLAITPDSSFEPKPTPPPVITPFSPLKEPVQFQGDEKQIADVLAQFGREWPGMKKRPVLNTAIRKRYLEMDKQEPLELTATDVLRQAAKRMGRQIVAETPDRGLIMQAARRAPGAPIALERAVTLCFPRTHDEGPHEFVESSDLIILKAQARPLQTANLSVSRKLMAKDLKTASRHSDRFETLSDLCASVDRDGDLDVSDRLAMLFGASFNSVSSMGFTFEVHSIYGMLSPSQRRAARSGGVVVPLSGLPFKARWLAYRILTSVGSIPQPSEELIQRLRDSRFVEGDPLEAAGMMWLQTTHLKEEPTLFLAQTAEREISLKFRVEETQAIYRLHNDPEGMMGTTLVSPLSAAREVVQAMRTPGASQPVFLCGGQTTLTFNCLLPRGARLTIRSSVKGAELAEAARPYTKLPEPYRSLIGREAERLRSQKPN